jgi:hypothetical protein
MMTTTIKTWEPSDGPWDETMHEPGRRVLITQANGITLRHYACEHVKDGEFGDDQIKEMRSNDLHHCPVKTSDELPQEEGMLAMSATGEDGGPSSDHDMIRLVYERQTAFRRDFGEHVDADKETARDISSIKEACAKIEHRFDRALTTAKTAVAVLVAVEILGAVGVGKVITAAIKAAAAVGP